MNAFLSLFLITFLVLLAAALLINFCRRRVGRTSHGLSGICHKTGGKMCSSCASQLAAKPPPRANDACSGSTPGGASSGE